MQNLLNYLYKSKDWVKWIFNIVVTSAIRVIKYWLLDNWKYQEFNNDLQRCMMKKWHLTCNFESSTNQCTLLKEKNVQNNNLYNQY